MNFKNFFSKYSLVYTLWTIFIIILLCGIVLLSSRINDKEIQEQRDPYTWTQLNEYLRNEHQQTGFLTEQYRKEWSFQEVRRIYGNDAYKDYKHYHDDILIDDKQDLVDAIVNHLLYEVKE